MKPITNHYDIKVPGVYICVNCYGEHYEVFVLNISSKAYIGKYESHFVKGTRLFGSEPLAISFIEIALKDFNVPVNHYNNHSIFEYSAEAYEKLIAMNVDQYKKFIESVRPIYPKWDDIKGNPAIQTVIADAFRHVCDIYPIGDMITMNYDERYESVIKPVWDMCMAKLNWESFCQNPEDESEEFMDFQQETMGNIGAEVLELIETRTRNTIAEYYKDKLMAEERAKLIELLTR